MGMRRQHQSDPKARRAPAEALRRESGVGVMHDAHEAHAVALELEPAAEQLQPCAQPGAPALPEGIGRRRRERQAPCAAHGRRSRLLAITSAYMALSLPPSAL